MSFCRVSIVTRRFSHNGEVYHTMTCSSPMERCSFAFLKRYAMYRKPHLGTKVPNSVRSLTSQINCWAAFFRSGLQSSHHA